MQVSKSICLALVSTTLMGAVAPASAGTVYAQGPHGGTVVAHRSGHYDGRRHGCCYHHGAGVATGLAVGTAVGVAAASRPRPPAVYTPQPVVYAAPPVAYAPPPVAYAPPR